MTTPRKQTDNILMIINTVMTGAALNYAISIEHRITALETKVDVVAELHAQETAKRQAEEKRLTTTPHR